MNLDQFVDSLNDEQLATLLLTMGNRKATNRMSDLVYKTHYDRQEFKHRRKQEEKQLEDYYAKQDRLEAERQSYHN